MNIKSIIGSQKIRHTILKFFSWVPDSFMLPFQYYLILHRWPNMKHPQRFTEKLQCYKASYRNDLMLNCVDKYLVRSYVENKLGSDEYLNVLYQVCDSADEINFDTLPEKFVIKTTDGGNGDNVLICSKKSELNIQEAIERVNSWRNKKYYTVSREWAYKGAKKSRVIVEQFLESDENSDGSIDDYKFLCYNGKFKYLWVDKNRYSDHRRGFWNKDFEFLKGVKSDHPTFENPPALPHNIEERVCKINCVTQ